MSKPTANTIALEAMWRAEQYLREAVSDALDEAEEECLKGNLRADEWGVSCDTCGDLFEKDTKAEAEQDVGTACETPECEGKLELRALVYTENAAPELDAVLTEMEPWMDELLGSMTEEEIEHARRLLRGDRESYTRIECDTCGGVNVWLANCSGVWNPRKDEWELDALGHDGLFCGDCCDFVEPREVESEH